MPGGDHALPCVHPLLPRSRVRLVWVMPAGDSVVHEAMTWTPPTVSAHCAATHATTNACSGRRQTSGLDIPHAGRAAGRVRGALMVDPWTCAVCGRMFPVVSLARDCEARHEAAE